MIDTIVTELAFMRVTPAGIVVEETAPGLTLAEIQAVTEPKLIFLPL